MSTKEYNFDGLIGPTHNYAGLAPGNLASQAQRAKTSSPRAAALQGLKKMRTLHRMGVPQAILPPQSRPNLSLLRRLGFEGNDDQVLRDAQRRSPSLLAAAFSGSSMWTANAATVGPSSDSKDGRVHFVPANLVSSLHRASEAASTSRILRQAFPDPERFVHHPPLPAASDLGDEGAANHTRFCHEFGDCGVHLFVDGSNPADQTLKSPVRFFGRQTRTASQCVARLLQIQSDRVVMATQNPDAIDAGVFHNDVIAVGHRNQLLCHELAFANRRQVYEDLKRASDGAVRIIEVAESDLSLSEAVSSYLFNSQIVTTDHGTNVLVAPNQCRHSERVQHVIARLVSEDVIDDAVYVDVDQSMANGGGPACLRLRVVLTPSEQAAMAQCLIFDEELDRKLSAWIEQNYRESLVTTDLADPKLLVEFRDTLDSLTSLLGFRVN